MTPTPTPAELAMARGRQAYSAGHLYGDNPFSPFVHGQWDQAMAWARGWRDARSENVKARINAFGRTYEANAERRGQYDR